MWRKYRANGIPIARRSRRTCYMKKIIPVIFVLLVVLPAITGCKKLMEAIFPGLDVDLPAITVTVPAIPYLPPNEMQLGTFTQHFNLDSVIRANTNGVFNIGDIKSVKVTKARFTILQPDQQNNISNFETVRLLFGSAVTGDLAEIAAINFPDMYADNYLYTPANAPELLSYFRTNELMYTASGKLRRITTKPVTLSLVVTVTIK
jgi:hypothetical protein